MKKRLLLSLLAIIMVVCMFSFASCKKDDDPADESSTNTEDQSDTTSTEGPEDETTTGGDQSSTGGDQTSSKDDETTTGGPDKPGPSGDQLVYSTTFKNVRYLRIAAIGEDTVTVKFNVYDAPADLSYEIKYSNKPITAENFDKATNADATISGSGSEKTVVIKNMKVDAKTGYYIAARSKQGTTIGTIETVRAGKVDLIPVKYGQTVGSVYHGETLRDLSKLFDEQDTKYRSGFYFPSTRMGQLFAEGNTDGKYGMNLSPIIDLEYVHYVDYVYIYYDTAYDITVRWAIDEVDFMAPDSEWDGVYEAFDNADKGWCEVEIADKARYVQVVFKDGEAPVEVMVYGYAVAEGDPVAQTEHQRPTLGEMMGICGFVAAGGGNCTVEQLSCATVLREYHNFGWSYNDKFYPKKASFFSGSMGNFDALYKAYTEAGIEVVPCPQWATSNNPAKIYENGALRVATYWEKFSASSYKTYADAMFIMAARYGHTNSPELVAIQKTHVQSTSLVNDQMTGLGYINWIELGNEPNGEDNLGYTPYQLAALTSAAYDGHGKTLTLDNANLDPETEYHLGIKNADPNMKVAMSGLAGIGSNYVGSMIYWMKANREDGQVSMDAFNVHNYCCTTYSLNGVEIKVGAAPEEWTSYGIDGLANALSYLITARDKYYPEKEVWLTEFGWDTNWSYETMTAAHAYGEYSSRQVQAMWLTRAYLILSALGIDKATMYMCEDVGGTTDEFSVGKYGTCGVFDGQGKAKDSYYYLYTLKETLGNMTFIQEIDSGRGDVWIYQFADEEGNVGYAVWCPTSDGTKVADYELYIGADSAVLTEAVNEDKDGVQTNLTATNGTVKINVSENPVYVVVNK